MARLRFTPSLLTSAFLCLAGCDPETGDGPEPSNAAVEHDDASAPESLANAREGDLVELEDGVQVIVPPPGQLVGMEVMYDDGNTAVATLVNDEERGVYILRPDDHLLGLPAGTAAACASKCNDTSFSYVFDAYGVRAKWKSRLDWSYKHNNSPVGKDAAINAFKHGAQAVPKQRNSCSMADQSNASQSYLGETNRSPNITKSGSNIICGDPDGHNVIGWGAIAGGTLAVTCYYAVNDGTSTYEMIEMDQRYDTTDVSWYAGNSPPNNCSNRYSLRGVATHEFGHAFGLGHTPAQCNQVMAPSTAACTSKNRNFGKGDVQGIRGLY